ncbi:cytochrome c [Seohaeicola sp. SP36]|uniref:c-type cytochrome n=1 Tax=unclassified Seohaeicola TaxID=2641111 RepID=UPI00237AD113|nr:MULTISPECIES: cytochrome c [unclassified Seohaeicola]MDD9706019.1 cytochrome c [Seohaeicola sp. 4SK31]MDD9734478.1 cytochrome c [Seohaeicola sp. SP36]
MRPYLAALLLLPLPAAADPVATGEALVKENCARCHAVTQDDASPNPRAIPFRFLGRLYPVEYLEEALAEGIMVSHEMPEFVLEAEQVTALILYLESIQVR